MNKIKKQNQPNRITLAYLYATPRYLCDASTWCS